MLAGVTGSLNVAETEVSAATLVAPAAARGYDHRCNRVHETALKATSTQ
jgi:hypothetical protein